MILIYTLVTHGVNIEDITPSICYCTPSELKVYLWPEHDWRLKVRLKQFSFSRKLILSSHISSEFKK